MREVVNRRIERRADPVAPSDPVRADEVRRRRVGNVELARIGNNLNQLTRSLHLRGRMGGPIDVDEVIDRVEQLRAEVAALHGLMRRLDERGRA